MRAAIILASFGFILGVTGFSVLRAFNHFAAIERSFVGSCAPVLGVAGPEDIQFVRAEAKAFISSLDRREKNARGAIHFFDPQNPLDGDGWRDRTGGAPRQFRPLGIDYFDNGDTRRLFVINEANAGVEVFDVTEGGELRHVRTFTERRLTSPNNIVAVGPDSFYVTNDMRSGRSSFLGAMNFLLRSPDGEVFFTDGSVWQIAAQGLRFANGVDVSPDGTLLYVAETTGNAVQVFDRDQETGRIAPRQRIALPVAPDNLNVDSDGAVWIAAHPKPLNLPRHASANTLSPSQVIMISPDGAQQTVYMDKGEEISASTVAARLGQTLLIGGLYDAKFLICELPKNEF
ncbi:MAG: SMP-30/gluconolactonase/LRE family protein [Pseudomonadota bacterium]